MKIILNSNLRLRVSGFTLASTAVLSRVKPRARPAGTLYKSITPSPIYGFNLLLLCVARVSAPFGSSVPFRHPPVAALHTLYKSNCYLYPRIYSESVVIFSFSGSAAAPSKFIYISLHQGWLVPPGKISICQLGLLPGD